MKKAITLVLLVLSLSSCATLQQAKKPQYPQQRVFVYSCDKKDAFTATFDKEKDLFYIEGFGGMRVLKHALSASGARYVDGQMQYWSKGDNATVEWKGNTYTCSIDWKKSYKADAKSRGLDYFAYDTDRSWMLDIKGDTLDFYTEDGMEKASFEKAGIEKARTVTVYKASNAGHKIEVVVGGDGKCHGRSVQADITYDEKKFLGCGDNLK